eukprot:1910253-Pleurochrysis_carterae.AAC.1
MGWRNLLEHSLPRLYARTLSSTPGPSREVIFRRCGNFHEGVRHDSNGAARINARNSQRSQSTSARTLARALALARARALARVETCERTRGQEDAAKPPAMHSSTCER